MKQLSRFQTKTGTLSRLRQRRREHCNNGHGTETGPRQSERVEDFQAMSKANVGIVGLGIYLPSKKMTAKEISEATGGNWSEDAVINKLGIVEKFIPSSDPCDGSQEMGALAALDCLKNTGVDPLEIDAILCITEEWKE